MKHLSVFFCMGVVLAVGGTLFRAGPVVAEPILGEESLGNPASAPAEKQETDDAMARFQAGDFAGSAKVWREACRKNADLPPAPLIMARLFLQSNRPKELQESLKQAMIEAPDDPETHCLQAVVALRSQDVAKAESSYKKAESLVPGFSKSAKRKTMLQTQIVQGLASVAELRKDWAGARKILEQQAALEPKNMALPQRIAYYLFQQKNVDGALEKLRLAAKLDPGSPTPEMVIAQFYQQAGDKENAKKWMADAITAAPKDLKTRLAAGYAALELGTLDEAMKHAIIAMQIDPLSFDAKGLRGLISVCQKDYVASELFFDAVLRKSPEDFVASNNLALALIEQNDEPKTRRALEYAETNAKRFPKSTHALSTYGWVLYKAGRLDEAEKALRAAAAAGPVSVDTAYYTARVLIDRGRKTEARKMLETALTQKGLSMCRPEAEALVQELQK